MMINNNSVTLAVLDVQALMVTACLLTGCCCCLCCCWCCYCCCGKCRSDDDYDVEMPDFDIDETTFNNDAFDYVFYGVSICLR